MSSLATSSFAVAGLMVAAILNLSPSPAADLLPRASYAPITRVASVPYGWIDFCQREPAECSQPVAQPMDLRLTAQSWKTLNRVNQQVNKSIEPVTNLDHWGTLLDHWDYATDGKGDCKIYALEKRRQLMAAGFPRQSLLMTIVMDGGEGHAVLTVKTDHGEFVLDNMTDAIQPWTDTGYDFVKRQAQQDPNIWLAIGPAARVAAR